MLRISLRFLLERFFFQMFQDLKYHFLKIHCWLLCIFKFYQQWVWNNLFSRNNILLFLFFNKRWRINFLVNTNKHFSCSYLLRTKYEIKHFTFKSRLFFFLLDLIKMIKVHAPIKMWDILDRPALAAKEKKKSTEDNFKEKLIKIRIRHFVCSFSFYFTQIP